MACFFLLLLPVLGEAQNKKDLEDKRKKIIRDIESTDRMLKKTTRTKEATYDRFLALQNQISQRENLIRTLSDELADAEQGILRNTAVVESLTRDVAAMQDEYGVMVRSAYRRKMLSNPLLYVLSADNLNQAFRRWLFLRKYDRYRKSQAEAIAATQQMLSQKINTLEETRIKKENLLVYLQGQKTVLVTELSDKDDLLKVLSKDESRLRQDLQKKQQAHEELNQAIERVIQEEVRKKVEESRRTKPVAPAPTRPSSTQPIVKSTPTSPSAATAEPEIAEEEAPDDNISLDFRRKRGNLPWPVEDGFISRPFGRQKHPTIKNIEITNNGVDIRTDEGSAVRAVYEGKVAGVQFIPGHDYTVILQHGNYYTVYSNLKETGLSKGEQVRARQIIGRVSTNAITGASELHFELWRQKERMNPAGWIRK